MVIKGDFSQSRFDSTAANDRSFLVDSTITISRLNQNGSAAVQRARKFGQVAITEHGKTVAFILSAEKVEALLDTMEILADPHAMKAIKDYQAGRLPMKDAECLDD
jgi:antitoxin (DNA-binding transcriptional repressor) of toxin-antitoxin stability system